MNDQMQALSAAITKADIAMKAAAWQIETLRADIDQMRKCLFELAYTAEEHGINLVTLTKTSQDTIVAMRLGGFK
jgi:HJR/Mrr/RecB family endonuclease